MREGSIVWKSLHLESKGFRRRYLISYDKRITRAYQTGGGSCDSGSLETRQCLIIYGLARPGAHTITERKPKESSSSRLLMSLVRNMILERPPIETLSLSLSEKRRSAE